MEVSLQWAHWILDVFSRMLVVEMVAKISKFLDTVPEVDQGVHELVVVEPVCRL